MALGVREARAEAAVEVARAAEVSGTGNWAAGKWAAVELAEGWAAGTTAAAGWAAA